MILLQEYTYLKNRYNEATFSVFTYDQKSSLLPQDSSIEYLFYFPHHFKKRLCRNIWYLLKTIFTIWKSDYTIIGGGGLLYDNEEGQSFQKLLFPWKLRVFLTKLFHKPLIYWSLGIHLRKENITKILPLFSGNNTYISVRDRESQKTLDSIGIKSILLRDPVLSYNPELPQLLIKSRPKIGLSFRSGFLQNELMNIEKIIAFLMARGYEVILLNHSFHRDNNITNDDIFLENLKGKYQLHSTKTIEETLEIYKELEFIIGMRLHSLILSLVHIIPFFALSYGKKTDEFVQSIQYPYSLTAKTFEIEIFKKRFIELERVKDMQKFALNEKNDTIKHEIYITTNTFFDGLEKSQRPSN